MMQYIRPAAATDLARIAEIIITNYRLNFYPIFRNDEFYFGELTVPAQMEVYREFLGRIWVYDDGVVKGVLHVEGQEVKKLFVEPILQGHGIGAALLVFAVQELDANTLWALEKNVRAIAFYVRHGFHMTGDRKPEADTDEYLVRMEKSE